MLTKAPVCRPQAFRSSTRRAMVCKASIGENWKSVAAATIVSAGLMASPAMAGVSIANVKSGSVVSSPVHLDFVVEGLTVKPAAEGIIPGTGHHHLVIDAPAPAEGVAIPFDDAHKHFGKGQTSVDLELPPGKHTLTLQARRAGGDWRDKAIA
ncbi:hypothetical protein GPECTOR_25g340 [Gonium pectorale]|uniref:DUF4399 domain-containing protein n=1 Tax=Gonium pectorale TaxID=33097 RepID=A0A150GG01_GONPE|nr:hypothetical protein GPECTOR_25g340 [Gonium pectorale]|eukprot:KXZ48756.1 hypothetical protein GPECTOR_25g340 [Gonium pectorale]